MKHPTEDRLRAYLDAELPIAEVAAIGEHLAVCADCNRALDDLRETADVFAAAMARMDAVEPDRWRTDPTGYDDSFSSSPVDDLARPPLRLLSDDAPPDVSRDAWRHAATSAPALVVAPRARQRRRLAAAPVMRWAAGIALAFAVGGSAAIAGGLLNGRDEPAQPAALTAASNETAVPAAGGVFGHPVNGAMEVVLEDAPAGSRVVVDWSDAEDVLVEVIGAPEARVIHRDGEERMVANLAGSTGVVHVTMPRGLRSATVVWQDRIVVHVADGTLTPAGAGEEGVVLETQR